MKGDIGGQNRTQLSTLSEAWNGFDSPTALDPDVVSICKLEKAFASDSAKLVLAVHETRALPRVSLFQMGGVYKPGRDAPGYLEDELGAWVEALEPTT